MKAVTVSHLTKFYGKTRGIEDITLDIEEGSFFGFIGPNGAGKSTTIRILLGLISADSGRAEVFGKDIRSCRTEILAETGYLPSEAMFYRNMKVKDILRLSAELRGKDCSREAAVLCERLELDTSRKVSQLSLGNRKKVSIVCALQHRPRLYVLDEPTSGLDPLMQREFYSILQERNEEGAAIFLSSHILSEIQQYCSHAAVIRQGRMLVSDRVKNLGHTGIKKVKISGVKKLPRLDGIEDVQASGDSLSFLYSGKADELLKALAELPLTDISITEPGLEEIFMHYYAKEDRT